MNTKHKVINRLLGICECEAEDVDGACFETCPDNTCMVCTRDIKHKGKHLACTVITHKLYGWD